MQNQSKIPQNPANFGAHVRLIWGQVGVHFVASKFPKYSTSEKFNPFGPFRRPVRTPEYVIRIVFRAISASSHPEKKRAPRMTQEPPMSALHFSMSEDPPTSPLVVLHSVLHAAIHGVIHRGLFNTPGATNARRFVLL